MFDLYVNRIFGRVSFYGLVMDLADYPFVEMASALELMTERLREAQGQYRDRKMPSFHALQILNGKRYDLAELLKPRIKPRDTMPSDVSA